jgi:alanine-glyoxylate transaminase/serine-glyoxylate transaminase/serine-pyruvate transaminase
MIEAAVRNGVGDRLLAVVGGRDGEQFARIAEACGKEVVRAFVPPGRAIEAQHLARFLDGPDVDAVSIVHAERSTGARAPLAELAAVVRAREDIMLLVDARGSLGGEPLELDLWQLDFVLAEGSGALGLPPGLGLAAASKRMAAHAAGQEGRGWLGDLARLEAEIRDRRVDPLPPLPLLHALEAQLARIAESGGIEARWRRHVELAGMVHAWAEQHGLALLAEPGRRSAAVSAIRLPPGREEATLLGALDSGGWRVGGSVEPGVPAIRIGHMGDLEAADLSALLDALLRAFGARGQ